jgi:hypothetical protein
MARLRTWQTSVLTKSVCGLMGRSVRPLGAPFFKQHRSLLSTSTAYQKYKLPQIPAEDESFVIRSPYSDVEIPETNLADFVWKDVEQWPDRPALVITR